jgi:hypothetical protein
MREADHGPNHHYRHYLSYHHLHGDQVIKAAATPPSQQL